jgi:hypothetical protein
MTPTTPTTPTPRGRAGYSGTPLARKLGIKPDHRVCVVDAPDGWSVPDPPAGVDVERVVAAPPGRYDLIIAFVREAATLRDAIALGDQVFPDGALWIAWPRKAGGHVSDVNENGIRDAALPTGLVDVKVAALDNDWSGLRLVWRKERRTSSKS